MKYKVVVDDNFHYMDESERYTHGEFESFDIALSAAKALVDAELRSLYRSGITADELYSHYTSFGNDPHSSQKIRVVISRLGIMLRSVVKRYANELFNPRATPKLIQPGNQPRCHPQDADA